MAESRLRAPDLGTKLRVSSCLRKCQKSSPDARRQQPFFGKSFYLDVPAGKNLQFLMETIQQLGGVIEGFLSKEVNYIVSSRRGGEGREQWDKLQRLLQPQRGQSGNPFHSRSKRQPHQAFTETHGLAAYEQGKGAAAEGHQKPGEQQRRRQREQQQPPDQCPLLGSEDSACGRNDDARAAALSRCFMCKETRGKEARVARLKAPFLKIEDESRKFRPFHHQFKSFPEMSFLGPKDASPFEAPTTLRRSHRTRVPRDKEPSPRSATRTVPRRKKGYCECCQEAYEELHGHLQSAQHQGFALEAHPYAAVDRIIAQLSHSFADISSQASLPRQPGSPALDCDPLYPETLPPGQPSHTRAASPRMREEDNRQAPGIPEQDEVVGSTKAPAEHVEADKVPGPVTSCPELGGSVDVTMDPPGTPMSRSPDSQCLLTSSGFTDFSSGPDLALLGHKRKVQSPVAMLRSGQGSPGHRPHSLSQESSTPCDNTRTTNGRHLSLPLPGPEPSPLASLLPSCHPQTSLTLPDLSPWQPTDRPTELWATQPPWPRGRYSPVSEDSECAAPGPISQQADQLPSCPKAPGQLSAHLHSAVGVQPPGGPAGNQTTSLPHPLPASRGASCSQWLWGPQPLPVPCLPVSQPQPNASRELLL